MIEQWTCLTCGRDQYLPGSNNDPCCPHCGDYLTFVTDTNTLNRKDSHNG